MTGGTGSRSESEEQPHELPDKYEWGTANAVGLAGLHAAIRFVEERGVEAIRAHEVELTSTLMEGLAALPGVTLPGPAAAEDRTATLSATVAGLRVSDVGLALDEDYGVLTRVGLHCAPTAHKTLGTFPSGTVRFGLGAVNTAEEVETAVTAVRQLAGAMS